jgi:large subunit ribosomal protein L9
MAKVDIILVKNVEGLGAESDEVTVAAGYARNYLIPYGLAVPSTMATKRQREVLRKRREEREAHERDQARVLDESLKNLIVMVRVKSGEDGRLFGSVTSQDIANSLKKDYELELDRHKIKLPNPIKELGDHEVEVHLHHDFHSRLQVKVLPEND